MKFESYEVYGIEHVEQLVTKSTSTILRLSQSNFNNTINIFHGDGRKGFSEYAPYDFIHVGACNSS